MLKWEIGNVVVQRIVELQIVGGTTGFWPQATPEGVADIPWLEPHFVDKRGRLKLNFQSLLVESQGKRIIVDTCFGNDKERGMPVASHLETDYLDRIAAAGFPREEVDIVMCTHMHSDHVGWNTMLVDDAWVPTFPNARYLVARTEYEHWTSGTDEIKFGDVIGDSVTPIAEAGLLDQVEEDHRITDEVWLEPSHGHTPCHVSVRISSEGEQAVITGDAIHHPFQIARPHWTNTSDYDHDMSVATRRRMLAEFSEAPILVIGTHFASPTAGYVKVDGDAHRFEPMEQENAEDERAYWRMSMRDASKS